ncbi:hypothetical protein BCEP4_50033 [Burkholderia cepacia]|nr:hypothetical protein BCEP4_50033 [Burkholderia cepacia]
MPAERARLAALDGRPRRRRQVTHAGRTDPPARADDLGERVVLADDRGDAELQRGRKHARIRMRGEHHAARAGRDIAQLAQQREAVERPLAAAHRIIDDGNIDRRLRQRGNQFRAAAAGMHDAKRRMPLQQSIKRLQDYRMVVGHGDGYCFHISHCVFQKT